MCMSIMCLLFINQTFCFTFGKNKLRATMHCLLVFHGAIWGGQLLLFFFLEDAVFCQVGQSPFLPSNGGGGEVECQGCLRCMCHLRVRVRACVRVHMRMSEGWTPCVRGPTSGLQSLTGRPRIPASTQERGGPLPKWGGKRTRTSERAGLPVGVGEAGLKAARASSPPQAPPRDAPAPDRALSPGLPLLPPGVWTGSHL